MANENTQSNKRTQQPKVVPLSAVVVKIAAKQGTEDTGSVAKKLRARIRNNFDDLAKEWPGLTEAKNNRDGNRYPPMPIKLAKKLIDAAPAKS